MVAVAVLVGLYGGILATNAQGAGVIYVDDDSTCSSGCGGSWTDAYTTVQDALAAATSGDEIWVAEGVYTPGTTVSDTFAIPAGVALYGGFAATETVRTERNWQANPSVLSGEVGGDDITDANGIVTDTANISGTNAYHVVTGSGVTTTAVLDGFTITAGQANGTSSPNDRGGGMYNDAGSPTVSNVHFSGNSADFGGGVYNYDSSPTLTNVTLSGNSATNEGGGMLNASNGNPTLYNVIVWNNRDASGTGTARASISNDNTSDPTVSHSLVQGCNPGGSWESACGTDAGGNVDDADPLFVTPEDPTTAPAIAGDLRLRAGSPAIDAGDNSVVSATIDLAGNPRIVDGDNDGSAIVDMGAYEASFPDLTVTTSESIDPVVAGAGTGNLTYVVTVENLGSADASGVALTDTLTLPAGVTVESVTPSGSAAWNGTSDTWTVGDLDSGSSETLTIVLTVDSSVSAGTDVIANEAAITAIDQADTDATNDSAGDTTSVDTAADLVVTKTDTPDPVAAGEMLTYTVAITNNGPSDAQNVVATDTMTDALTLDSTNGCAEDPNGAPACSVGTIAAGSTAGYTITALVDSATLADTITNTVTVTATTPEAAPGDESTAITTTVNVVADLALSKSDSPDPATAGRPLTYTLTITNHGPSQGWGVKVDDSLPLAYTHTGNNCGVSYSPPNPFEWVINDMPAGAVLTCVITGTVNAGVSGTITNTAFAGTVAFVTDPDPSNDSVAEPTTVYENLFAIGDATLDEGDAGTTAFTFTISRTNTTTAASVDYATGDATATAGSDYTAISDTVNFAASGAPTKTVTVDVSGDTLVELDETFFVTLSNPVDGGISDGQGVGTITNDDSTTLSIGDVTVNEPDGPAVFTVTLSATSALTTSVDYATSDGSAIAGTDYTAVNGTLDIAPGETEGYIAVPILDDSVVEETEIFTVHLSNPVSGTIATGMGTGTIFDGDNAVPALLDVSVTSPIDENEVATLSGVFSDTVTDPLTLTVDWDDSTVVTYTYTAGTNAFTETHRYLDDDPSGTPADDYTIGLTVADDEGATTNDSTTLTVYNVTPSVDAGADVDAMPNEAVAFAGNFSDTGTLDTHSINWDFGDGAIESGTLTPTHAYTAAGTYTATLTVTDDDGGAGRDDVHVTVSPYTTFLPLTMRPAGIPDLVVNELIVTEDSIEVIVGNQGTGPVEDEFWVDVYIDPTPAPTRVNQTWPQLADEGLVWGITSTALPLDPDETLTLTIGDGYYDAAQSSFSGTLPAGTPVYAQVDSANVDTDYGGVLEAHEISGGAYNNVAGPVFLGSTRTFDILRRRSGDIQPADMPARPRP